ncbi:hepatocyte growth factor-regulated tyrosine kinase substrate [Stylonychia lemnae]|uniref:Hepatocyte growth factor-regulated tyrosine kinase substrate n=1 Tax=Stylonychia lemnae TaxID=5949 RepID=A0A077ZU18_STYLE|nr:hepatocyte growth factor-regulated tyrosine kinase substrate [Stylonychia lemnae]|eukprot:CDW73367.1 hepatocyte growth factor-regulated tyrosine kinase substrate [Stylonychia lemnae]
MPNSHNTSTLNLGASGQNQNNLRLTMKTEHLFQMQQKQASSVGQQSNKSPIREVWTQKLQYVTLKGDKLKFYSIKNGLVEINEDELSFILLVQDIGAKFRQKKLKFTCSMPQTFLVWIDCFKKIQRPQWADSVVQECYICDTQFGLMKRQHHCRKCGTAVCKQCSKYFCQLPELAYYKKVRVCRACMEDKKLEERKLQCIRNLQKKRNLGFFKSTADAQNSKKYQGIEMYDEEMGDEQQFVQENQKDSAKSKINRPVFYAKDSQNFNSFPNVNTSNNGVVDESNSYLYIPFEQ